MTGSAAPALPEVLAWLRDVLWPPAAGYVTELAGRRDGAGRWIVLPDPRRPTLLVPASRRPAAAALRQFNDGMSQPARLRKQAVSGFLRCGGGRLVRGDRLRVTPPSDDAWEDLAGSILPAVLGVPRVAIAISVGRQLRPNLKPVLQISTPEGFVLAYAKIGWNDVTKGLVAREAEALEAYRAATPRRFALPSLLHHGTWNGLELTVVSPGPQGVWRRGRLYALPEARVIAEVAELPGGLGSGALGASDYWRGLSSRVAAVDDARADGGSMSSMAAQVEERFGELVLAFGSSHGDFTPWNLTRTGSRPFIWDWERWTRPAPLGLDAVHLGFEVGVLKEGLSVGDASRGSVARAEPTLRSLGLGEREVGAVRALQLVERAVRMEEGRRAGVAIDEHVASDLRHELSEARP